MRTCPNDNMNNKSALPTAAAGRALPAILPRVATHWASVLLFLIFGVKLLKGKPKMLLC
jgi:putative Ca2+/H+ antiporter (TMEM165/GDT1 family)